MHSGALPERVEQNQRDVELIHRIQRKDQGAIAALYDRYAPLLYSLALRICADPEDAEETIQEVFMSVWTKAESFSLERGTAYSWIVTMCRHKAIDRLRSRGVKNRRNEIGLDAIVGIQDPEGQRNPETLALYDETRSLIRKALLTLSRSEARILELSYYQGYSQSEIAKILKTPLGTIKTRMRQAILKLRTAFHKPPR